MTIRDLVSQYQNEELENQGPFTRSLIQGTLCPFSVGDLASGDLVIQGPCVTRDLMIPGT